MSRVVLGKEYIDTVTGYAGMATARNEIYRGSINVLLQRLDKSGQIEEVWITEPRLEPYDSPPKGVGFG